MASDSWREMTLGEFVRLQRGHDLPEVDRRHGTVPIMGSAGHTGFHDTAKAKGPGVVIGRSGVGSMGVVTYCATDYWPHNTVLYVTDLLGNDERFTYYFLRHLNLRRFDSGSAQASLNRNYIYPIRIRVPNTTEQRAIAHILGTLDDKIELNRQMNETLEAIVQALFKSWFVDFDPGRAKAVGRDPGLPQPIADLFPDRFENSELGEIPGGWAVGAVEDLVHISSGKRPDVRYADASVEARVPLWGGNGPMAFVSQALINYPILLTGRVGTLGSVFRITKPCWPSDNTLVLRVKDSRDFEYLFIQLKRIDFASLNRGSTQPLLTQSDLNSQPVLLPPTSILERFHAIAKELYGRIDASESESRTLAALRDTLLPRLISGELWVKDTEHALTDTPV